VKEKREFAMNEVSIEPQANNSLKYINLNPGSRFISERILRESYLIKPNTLYPEARPYVQLANELELGIVNTKHHESIAKAISCILTRSIEDAKDVNGGYLPEKIVESAQKNYVSPHAISNLWGLDGYRFVLTRRVSNDVKEVIGTALISSSKDTLFFFTSKYNCIRYSKMSTDVDFNLPYYSNSENKWFDQFDMPSISQYRLHGYNQLANFAVERSYRGSKYGHILINEIIKNYVLFHSQTEIAHSQPLICGKGLMQIADPSWKKYMINIGFKLRYGADTFFTDPEWAPLKPVIINGKALTNVEFNNMYDMPQIYDNINSDIIGSDPGIHIKDRIEHVRKLASSNKAKLQYNQLYLPFDQYNIKKLK
jgi:hypothetical protein